MERRVKTLEENQEGRRVGLLGERGKISWGEGHFRGQKEGSGLYRKSGGGVQFVEEFHYSFFSVLIFQVLSVGNHFNGPLTPKFTSFLSRFRCITGQSVWCLLSSSHFFPSLHKWLVQTWAESYLIHEPEFLSLDPFPAQWTGQYVGWVNHLDAG